MKRKKLGFMNIGQEVLTRNEMKSIMAGSVSGSCNPPCSDTAISCCCEGGKVNYVQTASECCTYCGVTC